MRPMLIEKKGRCRHRQARTLRQSTLPQRPRHQLRPRPSRPLKLRPRLSRPLPSRRRQLRLPRSRLHQSPTRHPPTPRRPSTPPHQLAPHRSLQSLPPRSHRSLPSRLLQHPSSPTRPRHQLHQSTPLPSPAQSTRLFHTQLPLATARLWRPRPLARLRWRPPRFPVRLRLAPSAVLRLHPVLPLLRLSPAQLMRSRSARAWLARRSRVSSLSSSKTAVRCTGIKGFLYVHRVALESGSTAFFDSR